MDLSDLSVAPELNGNSNPLEIKIGMPESSRIAHCHLRIEGVANQFVCKIMIRVRTDVFCAAMDGHHFNRY